MLSWALIKTLLFSPLGLAAIAVVAWVGSGWKHTIEAKFACNARVAKIEEAYKAEAAAARAFDESRLHTARVQASRDAQENQERAARDKKELEDYAASLKKTCMLGADGVRALRMR